MGKLRTDEIEELWENDNLTEEEVELAAKDVRKKTKGTKVQSGLVSSKINKVERGLIPSDEEKEFTKVDAKRFKKN